MRYEKRDVKSENQLFRFYQDRVVLDLRNIL